MLVVNDFLVLNLGKRIIKLSVADLLYVVCEDYICTLTIKDGRNYQVSATLHSLYELLNQAGFDYAKREVLVNMHCVQELQRVSQQKWRAVMCDGTVFDIAARRQKAFKDYFYGNTLAGKNNTLEDK